MNLLEPENPVSECFSLYNMVQVINEPTRAISTTSMLFVLCTLSFGSSLVEYTYICFKYFIE